MLLIIWSLLLSNYHQFIANLNCNRFHNRLIFSHHIFLFLKYNCYDQFCNEIFGNKLNRNSVENFHFSIVICEFGEWNDFLQIENVKINWNQLGASVSLFKLTKEFVLHKEWKIMCSKQQTLFDTNMEKKNHQQVQFIDSTWPWWLTIDFLLLAKKRKIIPFVPLHEKNGRVYYSLYQFKLNGIQCFFSSISRKIEIENAVENWLRIRIPPELFVSWFKSVSSESFIIWSNWIYQKKNFFRGKERNEEKMELHINIQEYLNWFTWIPRNLCLNLICIHITRRLHKCNVTWLQ